jgi:hypothetical protein
MRLVCPTSQTVFVKTEFSKKLNPSKAPSTVHGVVFGIFALPDPNGRGMTAADASVKA